MVAGEYSPRISGTWSYSEPYKVVLGLGFPIIINNKLNRRGDFHFRYLKLLGKVCQREQPAKLEMMIHSHLLNLNQSVSNSKSISQNAAKKPTVINITVSIGDVLHTFFQSPFATVGLWELV